MTTVPSRRRDALIRKLCYDWIRQYEPKRMAKFRRIAEIEHPPLAHRGPSKKGRSAATTA